MVNKFETVEQLNDYYAELFSQLTGNADNIGLSAEEAMRGALVAAYNKDLEIVIFNDDYEKGLYKKQIERERKIAEQTAVFEKKRLKHFLKKSKVANNKLFKKYKKSLNLVQENGLNTGVFEDVILATEDNSSQDKTPSSNTPKQNSDELVKE